MGLLLFEIYSFGSSFTSIITPQLDSHLTFGLGGSSINEVNQSISFDDFAYVNNIHENSIIDTISFVDKVLKQYPIIDRLSFTVILIIRIRRSETIQQELVFGQRNHRAGERKKTKPWIRLTYPDVVNKL